MYTSEKRRGQGKKMGEISVHISCGRQHKEEEENPRYNDFYDGTTTPDYAFIHMRARIALNYPFFFSIRKQSIEWYLVG